MPSTACLTDVSSVSRSRLSNLRVTSLKAPEAVEAYVRREETTKEWTALGGDWAGSSSNMRVGSKTPSARAPGQEESI